MQPRVTCAQSTLLRFLFGTNTPHERALTDNDNRLKPEINIVVEHRLRDVLSPKSTLIFLRLALAGNDVSIRIEILPRLPLSLSL
jgi:hypothetical protein